MTKLKEIWIESVYDGERERHAIRIDWDNDRHQAIHLDGLGPEDLETSLCKAINMLRAERWAGNI